MFDETTITGERQAEELRRARARWPETYGRWLLLAGVTIGWTLAVWLAFAGHDPTAVVFAVVGSLALGGASFYSRIRVISRDGLILGAEEVSEEVEQLKLLSSEEKAQLLWVALREYLADPKLQASSEGSSEAVRRARRKRAAEASGRAAQEICDAVADYLKEKGYSVAQELTGDDYRVDLVGERDGERVVAEIQLNAGIRVDEDKAQKIVEKLAPILVKQRTSNGIVVLPFPSMPEPEALAIFNQAGLYVLKVDLDGEGVKALD